MMTRYGFNIRTRSGQRVDHISIMAASREDAERRLMQMYQMCKIVSCHAQSVSRHEGLDLTNVIELISASDTRTISPAFRRLSK